MADADSDAAMLARAQRGESTRAIAAALGVNHSTVSRRLRAQGWESPRRTGGGRGSRRPSTPVPSTWEELDSLPVHVPATSTAITTRATPTPPVPALPAPMPGGGVADLVAAMGTVAALVADRKAAARQATTIARDHDGGLVLYQRQGPPTAPALDRGRQRGREPSYDVATPPEPRQAGPSAFMGARPGAAVFACGHCGAPKVAATTGMRPGWSVKPPRCTSCGYQG
jgi:hypothetical protein